MDDHQAFGLQAAQRLPHRDAAYSEALGEQLLAQRLAGRRLAARDHDADLVGEEIGRGSGRRQGSGAIALHAASL